MNIHRAAEGLRQYPGVPHTAIYKVFEAKGRLVMDSYPKSNRSIQAPGCNCRNPKD